MTLLALFLALAVFFCWLFLTLITGEGWFLSIVLVLGALTAAAACAIALLWLFDRIDEKLRKN